ncbi:MAG TPA: alanine--tRNA ligase [Actinomycetales bacterium]|nr:alanine--tRNA ligase [Actinomycetales bacterium]
METAEIRRRWLRFFGDNGHTVVPSAPLLFDDPNLLFVNAGMVPFVPYFIGQETPPFKRATSVQKCVRTLDIEEVGKTTRHGTFFQMNGNFSFGDYFKAGAIEMAWDLVTRPQADGGFGLPERDLLVTVYEEDQESVALWKRVAGLPDSKIIRLGKGPNFWSMGIPGPCGPCSEILLDRGPEYGPAGDVEEAGDRYLEFWNLVFMEYERGPGQGKVDYPILGELPQKNIDTGMGLERIAFLLQGVDNLYEIDEVFPVLQHAAALAGKRYGANHDDDVRLRVVADHVRSALMLIGDGVTPGNEARGYVLRRLLRRAVRSMRLLGVDAPAVPELLPVSNDKMKQSYPELEKDFARISQIAYAEEEAFRRTLAAGTTILDTAVRETRASGARTLGGDKAFQLHDTFGFPIDLTLEMAAEQGVDVDETGFRRLMSEQRDRAKADARAKKSGHVDMSAYRALADALGKPVEFTGYAEVTSDARLAGLLVGGEAASSAREGDAVEVVLDRTPFYAEGGGQLADAGRIEVDGAVIEVDDVQKPLGQLIVHRARVVSGEIAVGADVQALVDVQRRKAISRAHTATHMVHKAIREALGETATQAGSENAPGRFRFDFSATAAVPPSVLRDVESKVNALLAEDLEVHAEVMTQAQAREVGAMALFGEKYGDEVRVVSVGDWARELCGGTHAQRSGQLGLVQLLGESSIGSGVRRVEALVGTDAYDYLAREHALVGQLTEALKVRPEELPDRVGSILSRLRDAEKEIERMRQAQVLAAAAGLASSPQEVFGVQVVTHDAGAGVGADALRTLVLDVRGRLAGDRPVVVAGTAVAKDRPVVVVATNEEARRWGVRAGVLVREAAKVLGGGGGGKDDVAQGGGTDAGRTGEALQRIEHLVGQLVTGG